MAHRNEIETRVRPVTEDAMAEAVRILSAGGLVAFPTDTVYGVGAHAFQPQALERIYAEARKGGGRGKVSANSVFP
jgi:tRNA A37 threonylcarbamoyladenosine synthetase subunit TsaC/SUA5/YrdC